MRQRNADTQRSTSTTTVILGCFQIVHKFYDLSEQKLDLSFSTSRCGIFLANVRNERNRFIVLISFVNASKNARKSNWILNGSEKMASNPIQFSLFYFHLLELNRKWIANDKLAVDDRPIRNSIFITWDLCSFMSKGIQ